MVTCPPLLAPGPSRLGPSSDTISCGTEAVSTGQSSCWPLHPHHCTTVARFLYHQEGFPLKPAADHGNLARTDRVYDAYAFGVLVNLLAYGRCWWRVVQCCVGGGLLPGPSTSTTQHTLSTPPHHTLSTAWLLTLCLLMLLRLDNRAGELQFQHRRTTSVSKNSSSFYSNTL